MVPTSSAPLWVDGILRDTALLCPFQQFHCRRLFEGGRKNRYLEEKESDVEFDTNNHPTDKTIPRRVKTIRKSRVTGLLTPDTLALSGCDKHA